MKLVALVLGARGPRPHLPSATFLTAVLLLWSWSTCLAAQDPVFDATGFQKHRDYFGQDPSENIDTATGSLVLTFTDLVLPGNAGREMRFQRTYNSKTLSWSFGLAGVPQFVTNPDGPPPVLPPDSPDYFGTPILYSADGAEHHSAPMSADVYVTDNFWRYNTRTKTAELPDGTVCSFSATGALVQVRDTFENTIDVATVNGRLRYLQSLGNGQSREVFVTPSSSGSAVPAALEYLGRIWHYTVSGSDLTRVEPPVGPAWQFGYNGQHELTSVTSPHGGVTTYTYDMHTFHRDDVTVPEGRITVYSRVVASRGRADQGVSVGTWIYTYDEPTNPTYPELYRTTIDSPTGTRTVYFHGPATHAPQPRYAVVSRTVLSADGTELEREERAYADAPSPGQGGGDAVMTHRGIRRAGQWFTSDYDFHLTDTVFYADYQQPWRTRESGSAGTRSTTREFLHVQSPYLGGLVTREVRSVGSEIYERTWAYSATTGFRQAETAYGLMTSYVPDAFGNVATVARNGHARNYTYEWGVPKTVSTSEPGYSITRVINSDGTIVSQTQAGRTTAFEYDDLFRPTKVIPAGGTNPTITTYDNLNGRTATATRGGQGVATSSLTTTLDGFGRSIQTDNSVGVRMLTEYDAEGRKIKESYPFATTGTIATTAKYTVMEYDALGRVTKRTNPDNTFSTRRYDPGTVTIRDEEGRETIQTYEAFGDPDDARLVKVHDAKGNDWTYTYNGLGQLRTVTAPDGITRTWTYVPGTNRLATETHPESGTVTYVSYDGAGNLTGKTDAKGTPFVYAYDANERLTTVTAGSTPPRVTITYEPGSDNRATAVTDGITTRYTYDAAGRLEYRQDVVDGEVFSTRFGYDGNDRLTSIRYPKSGRTVEFARDAEGRILTVYEGQKTYASEFAYHPSGAVASYRAGNGLTSTFDFDPNRYWPTRIQSGALDLQYGDYDGVGNVRTIADARPAYTQTFAYDELDRLTGASGVYGTLTYAYDAHGNRTGGSSTTYEYDLSKLRLLRQGLRTFIYDDNGNLTSRTGGTGAATFTYTPENLAAGVTTAAGASAYTYDADQWRVKRVTGNQVSYFLRGPTGELLCEWRPGAATEKIRDCIYAGSRMLAVVTR